MTLIAGINDYDGRRSLGDMQYCDATGLWIPVGGTKATGKVPAIQVDGSVQWTTPAGGAGSYTLWDPDAPFTSPSVYDDEFTAATIDAKWTQVNAGSATVLNTTDVPGQLRITKTTNTTTKIALMQAIPGADFIAWMKARLTFDLGDFVGAGFMLATGVIAGAGTQYGAGYQIQGGLKFLVNTYTNYNSYSATPVGLGTMNYGWGPYLRLTRSGTTLALSASHTGYNTDWQSIGSWTSGVTLTHLGLFYDHERAATTDESLFDFYRVITGVSTARLGNSRTIITG